ncbi:MAG: cation:proton antiporter [bacterium]
MNSIALIAVALVFLGFGLLSKKLSSAIITPPMLFVTAGFVLSEPVLGVVHFELDQELLKLLLEITLVLVLFSDAARIDLNRLRNQHTIPLRMLLIGMPLTIVIGTAFAHAIPLGITFCEAALVAAILTPTDAALGQVVVSSDQVPEPVKLGLNVESGLNDGIALPVILVLASIASALATNDNQQWISFALLQLTFGPLSGIVIGFCGAWLIRWAHARNWVTESGEGIIALCIAGMCFMVAESFHGNGFIAAFTGGLVFGNYQKNQCHYLFEFAETEGQIFTLGTFFIFGALLLPMALSEFNIWYWVFAVFSLTIMRMIPVYFALKSIHLNIPTVLFLGWFGPRGLASILFVLLVLGETLLPHPDIVTNIVFVAVMISVFAHGLSAAPLALSYGNSQYTSLFNPTAEQTTSK